MAITAAYIEKEICKSCHDLPNVLAIVTMGSCARGEETYFTNINGEIELMSDYEMLIIVKSHESVLEINQRLEPLKIKLLSESHSPSFDLEWDYKTTGELERLDKRFIFFETKDAGKVIYGDNNFLLSFPDISPNNLNYSELNTIIIHRLYHVIKGLDSLDDKYLKYLIVRNSLDFSSALLPLTGRLISSYDKRMKELKKCGSQYGIPQELIDRHCEYLIMKRDYNSNLYEHYSTDELLNYFYNDFQLLAGLQEQLQNGKLFRISYRKIVSALYRRDIHALLNSIKWERIMKQLYNEMMDIVKSKRVSANTLTYLQNRMESLFGYC